MDISINEHKQLLRVEKLCHSFTEGSQKTEVLKGVSLQVCASETTAIVGPSGCGKSTLLYLLGLLDRPESGKIFLNNSEVSSSTEQTSGNSLARGNKLVLTFSTRSSCLVVVRAVKSGESPVAGRSVN